MPHFDDKPLRELVDLYRRVVRAHLSTQRGTMQGLAQQCVMRAVERAVQNAMKEIEEIREEASKEPRLVPPSQPVSPPMVAEEDGEPQATDYVLPAILVHVELPSTRSVISADWRDRIREDARQVFAQTFNLNPEEVQLEVKIREGSLWAEIQPTAETFALILGLYVGLHDAAPLIKADWQRATKAVTRVVEEVTGGEVTEIKEPSATEGYWERILKTFRRLAERLSSYDDKEGRGA